VAVGAIFLAHDAAGGRGPPSSWPMTLRVAVGRHLPGP
jgi:hypothetical protein